MTTTKARDRLPPSRMDPLYSIQHQCSMVKPKRNRFIDTSFFLLLLQVTMPLCCYFHSNLVHSSITRIKPMKVAYMNMVAMRMLVYYPWQARMHTYSNLVLD